jgi:hypothetical protein
MNADEAREWGDRNIGHGTKRNRLLRAGGVELNNVMVREAREAEGAQKLRALNFVSPGESVLLFQRAGRASRPEPSMPCG